MIIDLEFFLIVVFIFPFSIGQSFQRRRQKRKTVKKKNRATTMKRTKISTEKQATLAMALLKKLAGKKRTKTNGRTKRTKKTRRRRRKTVPKLQLERETFQ
jgi:hypothetical protein